MIGIDTNVLLRYVMQDDSKQSKVADQFFSMLSDREQGYVSLVAIIESVWVMESNFELTRDQVSQVILGLLESPEIKVDDGIIVGKAIAAYRDKHADFADALIELRARASGCTGTVTFDRDAVKRAGMVLVTEYV